MALHFGQRAFVIAHLEGGELEAVRRADDHHAFARLDFSPVHQFEERRQRHARVRAGVHARQVGARGGFGHLVLTGLLHNAVALHHRLHGLFVGDRVANLNGRRKRPLRADGHLVAEAPEVALVEGIRLCRLRRHQARHLVDQAQVAQQFEPLVERADVAQIAHGDDDPVGHFPIELAQDLNRDSLLPLNAQAVH